MLREEVRKEIASRGWETRPFTARLEYANFGADQVLKVTVGTRSEALEAAFRLTPLAAAPRRF